MRRFDMDCKDTCGMSLLVKDAHSTGTWFQVGNEGGPMNASLHCKGGHTAYGNVYERFLEQILTLLVYGANAQYESVEGRKLAHRLVRIAEEMQLRYPVRWRRWSKYQQRERFCEAPGLSTKDKMSWEPW